jgi:molecular chaperone GrpE
VSEHEQTNEAAQQAAEANGEVDAVATTEQPAELLEDKPAGEVGIEQLQEQLVEAQDAVLRAKAEAQNARRRAEKDVEHARKYALEKFCGELLPVVDNLERALEAAQIEHEAIQPISEGIDLTLKSFLDVLAKFNVERLDPVGEPFDPQLHQAMTMVENPEVEPNSVMAVMQKGFTLNGRLVRPAMVVVSKAVEGDAS